MDLCIDLVVDDLYDVEASAPVVDVEVSPEEIGVVTVEVTGPPGPEGPSGPPGEDGEFLGTAWWYGQGPPNVVIGAKAGDYYVDTDSGVVYELN